MELERFSSSGMNFLRDGLPCLLFFIAFRLYLNPESFQFRPGFARRFL